MRQARRLPARTRRRLLNQNPDIASRHFYSRFKAFFEHIVHGDSHPLGKISDYFWRVKFQRRGSPHIHGLLWIEDAPNVLELSQTIEGQAKLAAFVDKHISARTYREVQSSSCSCSHLQERTKIDVERSERGGVRINILCERDDAFTNNYCHELIQTWRANMDIKLIGNAYGAAEYTAAYVSKAEPDTAKFRAAITKALEGYENRPELTLLRRVANASIATRELSAQEALWILQDNLPMSGKSRNVLKVKIMRHSRRFYRVDMNQCLHEMETASSTTTHNTPQVRLESIEKAYAARPHDSTFNHMSFRHFCEHFEECSTGPRERQRLQRWERIDKHGFIKGRQKPQAIVKTPRLRVDDTNADYCFSELFLNVPWRELHELPESDEDCVAQYKASETLHTSKTRATLERQQQLDIQQSSDDLPVTGALPEAPWTFVDSSQCVNTPKAGAGDGSFQEPSLGLEMQRKYTTDDYERAKNFLRDVIKPFLKETKKSKSDSDTRRCKTLQDLRRYPIGLTEQNMTDDQWLAFAPCMKQSRERHLAAANNSHCEPFRSILNGEGGSGKSWLIQHIVKDIHLVWDECNRSVRNSKRVLLMAHHGAAAFNIKGSTICSALGLPQMHGNGYNSAYRPLESTKGGLKTLRRLQDKYRDVQLVVIDEYSVISCGLLFWIDQRLREIWPTHRHVPFGGRDVILAGDMGQLSPVLPSTLATPYDNLDQPSQRCRRRLWETITNVCTLRTQNRGPQDPQWFDALRRLREMTETKKDIALFNTRVLHDENVRNWTKTATHISYRNADVDAANVHCLQHFAATPLRIFAQHEISPNLKLGDICQPLDAGLIRSLKEGAQEKCFDRDKVIAPQLNIAIGVPVTLTHNLEQSAGLCNGTKATIYDLFLVLTPPFQ